MKDKLSNLLIVLMILIVIGLGVMYYVKVEYDNDYEAAIDDVTEFVNEKIGKYKDTSTDTNVEGERIDINTPDER